MEVVLNTIFILPITLSVSNFTTTPSTLKRIAENAKLFV